MESEQFTLIIDYQMKLKPIKPTLGGFAASGDFFEHPMAVDMAVMTNGDGRGINKRYSRGLALTLLEISISGDEFS